MNGYHVKLFFPKKENNKITLIQSSLKLTKLKYFVARSLDSRLDSNLLLRALEY
jgi:hypothetical protein